MVKRSITALSYRWAFRFQTCGISPGMEACGRACTSTMESGFAKKLRKTQSFAASSCAAVRLDVQVSLLIVYVVVVCPFLRS